MENAELLKKKEKEFLHSFPTDANLSDHPEDIIKYAFFHFTKAEFLKKSRVGILGEGIEDKGLIADIGENSKNFEDKKRCYYSIGALGTLGLANRVVFLNMVKLIEDGMDPLEAKKIALQRTVDSFSESVYLKMNINDGIEFESSDFMTRRNSHTIKDVDIPKEKLELISVDGSNNALDVLEFLYNNCYISQIRLNSHVVDGRVYEEKNYIEELMEAIRQRTGERQQVLSKLETIELFSKDLSKDIQEDNEKSFKTKGIDDDSIRNRYQRTEGPLGRNERAVDKFIKMLHQHEKSDNPNVRKITSNIDNLKDIAPNFTIFESEKESYYMHFFGAININVNSSDFVISHEFGHAILGLLNNTKVPENYEQITKNTRTHCVDESTKDKFIDYIVYISDSENQDRTEAQKGPVSDIISAVFQYPKLEFRKINKACVLPSYHNRDYYFDEEKGIMKTDKIFDECFANYYSLVANNCHKELEDLRMLLGDEWMQTMETELEKAAKTIEMVQEKYEPDAMEQIKSTILGVNESNVPDRIIELEKQNEKTEDERRRIK